MRSFTLLGLLFCLSFHLFGQSYSMDGTPITDCGGFFLDSGGGNGNYGPNENFTTTICSDGTTGTHIKLIFSGVSIAAGDQLCFFDGPDATATQLSCHGDFLPGNPFIIQATAANPSGCITITFNSDGSGQDIGWSADIDCEPSCQTILATLVSTDPVISPADTGYIDICPGDRVFLNAAGEYPQDGVVYNHSDATSSFTWDFGDGTEALGPNTSHVYDEPGGYIIQLTIEDQFGCKNTNFISQRVRVSTYPNFELGELDDVFCSGDTISLNANVSTIDSTYEVSVTPTEGGFPTGGVRSDSLPLPDGTGATYATSIVFTNFSPGQVLTNINDLLGICVNMEHSWMHDLQISLVCPDGTSVMLQEQMQIFDEVFLGVPIDNDDNQNPPTAGQGADYCWTPNATNGTWTEFTQSTSVSTLPSGDYSAFGNLEEFLGCPLNGEWTIIVQDLWGSDNGWIFEWSIDFAPELYPDVETFTPELVNWEWDQNSTIVFYSPDSITAALNNAGRPSYTFSVTDNFGCTYDTTVVVEVLPPTHPDCYDCDLLGASIMLSDTSICEGESVFFDAETVTALEDEAITFEAFSNQEFDANIHPPGNPIASEVFVSYINPAVLTDPFTQIESICVNLEHSNDGDVEIRLLAPNGVIIELSTDNGGSGNDYTNTCFTPNAGTPITSGSPPFTGDWQPEGSWADLIGASIEGNWTLLVADDQNGFGGTFIDWSITFNTTNEYSYFWSPAATLSCSNCPDPVATPLVDTEYIVTGIDAFGCVIMDTVNVSFLTPPPAPIPVCGMSSEAGGGSLTIDWPAVPGAASYEISLDGGVTWLPSNGPLSHTVSGLSDGEIIDFQVRMIAINITCPPFIGTLQCTFIQPCEMAVDTSATIPPTCWNTDDASVFMSTTDAQSPVSYSIDGGPAQGPNITGVSAGEHTVIATDDAGCTASITFTITSPDTIFMTLATDSVNCNGDCDGQSVALATGGAEGFSYVWNTVPATFDATAANLCFGNYTVTATDANGCSIVDMTSVDQPINLLISSVVTNNVNCFGAADGSIVVTPFGGTPPYSYQWDDPFGQTADTVINLGPGLYNVTVTDDNGCTVTANAGLFEPNGPLTAFLNQTFVGCNDASEGIAQITPSGGTGPYTYLWSDDQTTAIATDLDAVSYSVTVTDFNGCTLVESLNITDLDPIVISLDGTIPTCFGGADGEVTVTSVSGGAAGYTYEWNTTPPQTGTSISNVLGGVEYILVVTDAQGCTGTASYQLGEAEEIFLSMGSTEASCNGLIDGDATVININGGSPGYTYQWDAAAGGQTTATAIDLGAGTYFVTITDLNGCTGASQVEVEEPEGMQLFFETGDNFCSGRNDGFINLNIIGGTPNYTFLWENGETTANIDSLFSGGYSVTVTDGNGCSVVDSAGVNGPPPLEAIVEVEDVDCFGDENGRIVINLEGGTPPYRYSLDNEEFTGSNILIGLETGTYDLYAVDANGCTWSSDAFVDSPDEFSVFAGDDVEIELGESIELVPSQFNGVGSVSYFWDAPYFGTLTCDGTDTIECERPLATPQSTIIYEVYGVDDNGCEDTDMITVRVLKNREIYVPTGFTPNGDGENDFLWVFGPEETIVKLFRVYDRWGNLVYEYDVNLFPIDPGNLVRINSLDFGWDGNFKASPMNPGVFVWYVEVEYIDGFTDIFKGSTTLIR